MSPYLNEDGDWWVPVKDHSYLAARHEVIMHISYEVPEEGTLRYMGKEKALLCDKHTADEIGPMCDDKCSRYEEAYHFMENRKW